MTSAHFHFLSPLPLTPAVRYWATTIIIKPTSSPIQQQYQPRVGSKRVSHLNCSQLLSMIIWELICLHHSKRKVMRTLFPSHTWRRASEYQSKEKPWWSGKNRQTMDLICQSKLGLRCSDDDQSKQRRSTVIGPSSCHTCSAKMPVFILDSALGFGYWS